MPPRFPPHSGGLPGYSGRSTAVPPRPPATPGGCQAPPPHRAARTGVLAGALATLLAGALLAGCDRPAEMGSGSSPAATPTAAGTTGAPRRSPSPASSSATPSRTTLPVFSELTAEPCRGYPSGDQVIGLLRTIGLLPATGTVTVATGPMCAGSWQYTVLQTSGRDPLQVVTKGPAYALTLVTAGTDVCTIDVRALAPAGIRAITRC